MTIVETGALFLIGTSTAAAAGFNFTHIGSPDDALGSEVTVATDDGNLAGGSVVALVEASPRPYARYTAVRWTPEMGIKTLPNLSDNAATQTTSVRSYVAVRDLTADGSKLLFNSHTTSDVRRATAVCSPDGSNIFELTTLPGGEKITIGNQISDGGAVIFGYDIDVVVNRTSRWTAATGFEVLALPAPYNRSAPAQGAISTDGAVSAGAMFTYDADFNQTASQAYWWTAAEGVKGIGYLPGHDRSNALDLSADGSVVLGSSSNSTTSASELFLWKDGAMTSLGYPHEGNPGDYFVAAAAMNSDVRVVTVAQEHSFCPLGCETEQNYISYIMNPENGYYVEFREAVAKARGTSAIKGWRDFYINGVTDDGNTVYGNAVGPGGKFEGFIGVPAHDGRADTPPEHFDTVAGRLCR